MASFNGQTIFGVAVTMETVDNPRSVQTNSYPGLNGTEELDQGKRGRYTVVSGQLVGATPADLNANEMLVRSYDDGLAYVLTDTFGNLWANVKLESFEPQGRVRVFAWSGVYFRPYRIRMKHL